MDPQLRQLYKCMFENWTIVKQSLWQRIKSKFTNKYKITLYSPINYDDVPWKYKITIFVEPEPREAAVRGMEICEVNGEPRKLSWYFEKPERYQL